MGNHNKMYKHWGHVRLKINIFSAPTGDPGSAGVSSSGSGTSLVSDVVQHGIWLSTCPSQYIHNYMYITVLKDYSAKRSIMQQRVTFPRYLSKFSVTLNTVATCIWEPLDFHWNPRVTLRLGLAVCMVYYLNTKCNNCIRHLYKLSVIFFWIWWTDTYKWYRGKILVHPNQDTELYQMIIWYSLTSICNHPRLKTTSQQYQKLDFQYWLLREVSQIRPSLNSPHVWC